MGEYIPNQMTCEEEANLAWSLLPSSPFIPKCQSQNASLYDGCQCDSGMATEHFRTQCYCSDEFGNMIDGKTAYVMVMNLMEERKYVLMNYNVKIQSMGAKKRIIIKIRINKKIKTIKIKIEMVKIKKKQLQRRKYKILILLHFRKRLRI